MNLKTIITALGCGIALFVSAQNKHSLVPDTPSKAPDYFCTWNLQGYLVSHQDTKVTRKAMNEDNLFGKGKYQNWANCYPRIREDLYLVLDTRVRDKDCVKNRVKRAKIVRFTLC